MRIALSLEYDGSFYCGWQYQPGGLLTIQDVFEQALSHVANEPIRVTCAGRTDKGVHAFSQVVHFDTSIQREEQAWHAGTNFYLPPSIRVKWAKVVTENFHARFSALRRTYRYIVLNKKEKSVFSHQRVTPYRYPLNETVMQTAADYLLGEHDFSSFRGSNCQSHSPIRTMDFIRIDRYGDILLIEMRANAFLYHMVRNIMGVLFEIGCGKRPVSWMQEVLLACDRRAAGVTALPDGLYLTHIEYSSDFNLPESDINPLLFV